MAEFLGARISLVSRSDIRYVGTLHEINSENSTVALENVSSFGTENRKENPDDYIPPSDSVYEYIVFRGSDVKDLRIEQTPAVKENKPPQVPNDPAILGSGSRPTRQSQSKPLQTQRQASQGPPQQSQGQAPQPNQGPPPPPFGQQPHYPPFYPPPPAGWGRGGPPPPVPGGFPPMPYGAPPGWYPGPQGFPPGPFPLYGYPPVSPGQFQQPPQNQPPKPAPIGPSANKQPSPPAQTPTENPVDPKDLAKPVPEVAAPAVKAPSPPTATKPSPREVQAAIEQPSTAEAAEVTEAKGALGSKTNNRVTPAIPLQSPAFQKAPLQRPASNVPRKFSDAEANLRDATQAATAAVAAAMAKLPTGGQMNGNGVDNLTKKVNEMRVNDAIRAPRLPGAGGTGFAANRGVRGGRGGARNTEKKVEVPESDFDFESANAKFNKQDLIKEAIAGSPVSSPTEPDTPAAPAGGYNKASSFFDDISSESKDRMEANGTRPGGREWRGEEQKKNVETFGQGSVDNGYRGGFRGRGRGRGGSRGGRGYSGNGQPGRGRGGYRGRGDSQAAA
ncbi:uncharacterized protein L3040_009450 [Drepanopeziza brunnea f. sp. 'multigermtubi']|uniref:uncharacterized protein n=1 Tax=Drepanopeziza brunnea f. sp. 'multigermtubi' TaxID=698441 RepID=UPI00239F0C91|nr:hypothetical protein L3040_009450 [Drepanopeziza brunnea f. sp. 'multigermtubi']